MSPLLVALLLCGAEPSSWPVAPQVGVGFVMMPQALSIAGEVSGVAVRAPSGVTALTLGIGYRPWAAPIELGSALSGGLGSLDGHVLLGAHQQALYRLRLGPVFSLAGGLAASAVLDVNRPAFSAAHLGLLLGARLWRIELLWLPALQVPLGGTQTTVGGATVSRGMATALLPLSFSLRLVLGPLTAP